MMCRRVVIAVWTALMGVSLVTGCATTKNITQEIVGGREELKKIVSMPAVNRTGYGGKALQEDTMANLETFLKRNCEEFIVLDYRKMQSLLEELVGPPSEQIDNLTLAKFGRYVGANTILETILSDVECVAEKSGIYGFRDTIPVVRLKVRLRASDPQTATILFDEVFESEAELGEMDCQNIRERKGYHKEILNQLLIEIADQIGETVSDQLCDTPWKGYITGISGDVITLSAGEDVGLAPGDVLEVYGVSGAIEGPEGQTYLLSGPKIGEIRLTGVGKDESEAETVEEGDFRDSSHVQRKD